MKNIPIRIEHYLILTLLVFTSLILPLIHTNIFRYTFIVPKFALYDIVSSFITIYYLYYRKEFKLSSVMLLSLTILLFMFISLFQSANIAYSFELIFRFFNLTIFIALIYELLKSKTITIEHIGNLLSFTAFIFLLYYFYGTKITPIFTSKTSFSPIGHINYTAHVLNIWIPLLLLNFFIQKNKFFKYSSLIIMLFLTDMLIVSGARGSILGLILSEVFIIFLLFIKYKSIKLYPIITISLLSLFFIHQSLAPSTINAVIKKIDRVTIIEKNNIKKVDNQYFSYRKLNKISSNRLNVYNNTFDMILDNPWGVGVGNYEYIHPLYAKVGTPFATTYVGEKKVFTNPHNIILKFISEIGWIGGILFVALLLLLSKMVITTLLRGEKIDYMIAIAFGATLFHSMLSAVFLTPTNLFFSAFLFGILLYRYYLVIAYKTLFVINKIYLKSFILLIPLFFTLFYLSKYYNQQFTTQRNFSYLEIALKLNPYNDSAVLKRARFTAYAKHDYSLAIYYLEKYLELYPYNINGHIKKADFEYRAKRYKDALKTIEHLLSFDKRNKKMLSLKKKVLKKLLKQPSVNSPIPTS